MDFERKIYISSDFRTMTLPKGFVLGVYNDKDSHKVCFNIPRYYNGIDLSEYVIYVNSTNSFGDDDQFMVKEIEIGETYIEFIWLVQRLMYIRSGTVTFTICMKKSDDEGVVVSEYNSTTATAEVLVGLEPHGGVIEDVEKDIVVQILNLRNEAREFALEAELAKNSAERAQELSEGARDVSVDYGLKSQSYATGDAIDESGEPYRANQGTDNAKYYKEQAKSYADTIGEEYKTAQSYARGDAYYEDGREFRSGQETDNSKYYSEQSAIEKNGAHDEHLLARSYSSGDAEDSSGNSVRVGQETDNAKYYSENSKTSANNSDFSAKMSESYARGGVLNDNDDPFRVGQETDNAKYYSENSENSADHSEHSAQESEAYAVGTIDGLPVEQEHDAYHNNSKWYSEKSREYKEQAEELVYPFNGATSENDGTVGLVPKPLAGDEDKVLHGNGSWEYPDNIWCGRMSDWEALTAEEKSRYKHVDFIDDYEEVDVMEGSTELVAGTQGLVPAPSAGSNKRALACTGHWVRVPNDIFTGTEGEWERLTDDEKAQFHMVIFWEDVADSGDPGLSDPFGDEPNNPGDPGGMDSPDEPDEPENPEEPGNGGEEP